MLTVKQILKNKGGDIWSIKPDKSVLEAVRLMSEREIGALMVMEGDKPVGIVSERDYARKVILKDRSSRETLVQDIMTRRIVYVQPDMSVTECMALMKKKKIRHLPVMDANKLVGMLSMRDLFSTIVADQEYTIHQLEQYISG